MKIKHMQNGCPFGTHRVIRPEGVLPQPAEVVNNNVDLVWDNELLINVERLNIDSASFTQIKNQAENSKGRIRNIVIDIVNKRGKMHNPVTGSGGVLIGAVEFIGSNYTNRYNLNIGDRIVSLVSLSLTPLKIHDILEIKSEIDQIKVEGKAILFDTSILSKLPKDIPDTLALAILDVCGAPAQTARLVKESDTVVVIGAGGKSGILCTYEARKKIKTGKVIGIGHSDKSTENITSLGLCDTVLKLDATDALTCHENIKKITDGKLADLVINCVNIPDTELASILMCRDRGVIYFFSMATSFTKAALGAEGVGKDIDMIIGNGYAHGHAETALNILREAEKIRELYETLYC